MPYSTRVATPIDVSVNTTAAIAALVDVERRLAEATTPEDANLIRHQVAALQKLLGRRRERFEIAFTTAIAFLMASIRAGEIWSALRPGRGRRTDLATNGEVVSAKSVGFASHQDASRCVELARLDPEYVTAYYDDCRARMDLPTLGGALAFNRPVAATFRDYSDGEACAFEPGSGRCWHPLHAHDRAPLRKAPGLFALLALAAQDARARGWDDVAAATLRALDLARSKTSAPVEMVAAAKSTSPSRTTPSRASGVQAIPTAARMNAKATDMIAEPAGIPTTYARRGR